MCDAIFVRGMHCCQIASFAVQFEVFMAAENETLLFGFVAARALPSAVDARNQNNITQLLVVQMVFHALQRLVRVVRARVVLVLLADAGRRDAHQAEVARNGLVVRDCRPRAARWYHI